MNNVNTFSNKEKLVKQATENVYTDINSRLEIMRSAINNSITENGVDSIRRYLEYINSLVLIYTNIDTSDENVYDVYDAMYSTGVMPILLKEIGEEQIKEINMFYALVTDEVFSQLGGDLDGSI